MVYTKIYVIECKLPFHWYVGSTFRELYARIDEHEANYGCKWTQRNGFRRMAIWADVPHYACSVLEDERVADARVRDTQCARGQLRQLPGRLLRNQLVAAPEPAQKPA